MADTGLKTPPKPVTAGASRAGSVFVPAGLSVRGSATGETVLPPPPTRPATVTPAAPPPPHWEGFDATQTEPVLPKPVTFSVQFLTTMGITMAALLLALPAFFKWMAPIPAASDLELARTLAAEPKEAAIVVLGGQARDVDAAIDTAARSASTVRLPQDQASDDQARQSLRCTPPNTVIVLPVKADQLPTEPDQLDRLKADRDFEAWFDAHYARNPAQQVRLFRTRLFTTPAPQCAN